MELYPETAKEWLEKWDDNESVWSIEMGGLGPGYGKCIQITCAEILRFLLSKNYDHSKWKDKDIWEKDREEIEAMGFSNEAINNLRISWAQWGAALSLALSFYRQGVRTVMEDKTIADRRIQVQRQLPSG